MRIIRCEDVSESEAESIRSSRPILLVGSAVSIFGETNLPNGETVASDLSEWLAAKGSQEEWPKWLITDARQLPFEAILEAYPDQDRLPEILCRLFGQSDVKPNSLHAALGDGLLQGLFSGLITTNYDLAFDNYFVNRGAPVTTIVRERDWIAVRDRKSTGPPYWKIHGTASENDTVIANLARERRMDVWKRNCLMKLAEGRTIVFLGYSGRDFDICPELACLGAAFNAVWLAQPPKRGKRIELNANQFRIIEKSRGQVVLGDIFGFVGKLCQKYVKRSQKLSKSVNVRDFFDSSLLMEWRVRLLKRMSCPRFGLELLRSIPHPQSFDKTWMEANMLIDSGFSRKGARLQDSSIAVAHDNQERLTCLLDASTAWWVCGSWRNSRSRLRSARQASSSTMTTSRQRGQLAEAELLQLVLKYTLISWTPAANLRRRIQLRGREYYLKALAEFETCDLDLLYSVHHDAERMGIAEKDGFVSAADLGFKALGLRILQSQKERDRIMDLRTRLTFADLRRCHEWWRRADRYGWKPESWKWAWILIWYGGQWKRCDLWRDWWRNFRNTEYPLVYRVAMFSWYFGGGLKSLFRNLKTRRTGLGRLLKELAEPNSE
jgi:hypothetical protein